MEKYPLRLIPYKKEVVWGGTRLRDGYGKDCNFDRLGETWELSVREKENSVIANGEYAGMTLKEYLGSPESFPLLVKFLDARDSLSVQVHPEKTEMWYIVEAEPDAKLVYGLSEKYDRETIDRAIANGSLEEHLDYVNVKAGEVYFIPSGLVHAICAGIVIAEIQENSDTTYRLYDYMRPQPDGSLRELHVTESLDTIRDFTPDEIETIRYSCGKEDEALIANCKFFNVRRYVVEDELTLPNTDFLHILCLSGSGEVSGEPIEKGDGYYIPEGMEAVTLTSKDKLEILVSAV